MTGVPALPAPHTTGGPRAWAASPLDWPQALVQWLADIPAHAGSLWHHLAALWWPWLPLFVLAVAAGAVAVRLARWAAWRRAAAGGYWVAITPPRTVEAADWDTVWRRLKRLAARARGAPWRLARPPLAFEVFAVDGRLTAGLWLPGWVPRRDVAAEVARAWPGATVEAVAPPTLDGQPAVAGYRLAASTWHPEMRWLVDDIGHTVRARAGADPSLGRLLAALGEAGGPGMLQVLVRPATRRRLAHLRRATRRTVGPPRTNRRRCGVVAARRHSPAAVRAVRPAHQPRQHRRAPHGGPPTTGPGGRRGDARGESEARRPAAPAGRHPGRCYPPRAAGGAGGGRGGGGRVRRGVGLAATVALRRPAVRLSRRRAGAAEWVLLTARELGVLAHLPPDPALYGFDTAALHRPYPGGVSRADPEHRTGRGSGWTRHGWTPPHGAVTDDSDPYHNDDTGHDDIERDDDTPEAA